MQLYDASTQLDLHSCRLTLNNSLLFVSNTIDAFLQAINILIRYQLIHQQIMHQLYNDISRHMITHCYNKSSCSNNMLSLYGSSI